MLQLPSHVQLEITDICNLRCEYCYHFNTNKMPKSNDLDDKEVLQLVQQMVDAQIYSLVITGGEPLLRPALVIKIVEIAKQSGMFVSINTNLLLLTKDIADKLKKSGVDSLLVSCTASNLSIYKQITRCGDFKVLQARLKLLLDTGISCMVNMVVTPTNCQFIRSTAVDMSKIGIKKFAATPAGLNVEYPNPQELLSRQQTVVLLEDLKWCADNLGMKVDILEPLPKCFLPDWCWEKDYTFTKRVCQAGRMSVSISNRGDVRPCSHNPNVYGNLFQETLKSIWDKMLIYRDNSIPSVCKSCPVVLSCNGACRTNSLALSGLLDKPDRFVVGHMHLVPKEHEKISIKSYSVISFNGSLRWRREGENYSISSKAGGGNLIVVNEEMFRFVRWLEEFSPLPIEKLIENRADNSTGNAFIKIIEILLKKEFVCLI